MAELKYWTGSAWAKPKAVKRWSGSAWVDAKGMSYWNGSKWVVLSIGGRLYHCDRASNKTYELNPDTLVVIKSVNSPRSDPYGIGGISVRLYNYTSAYREYHELNIDTLVAIKSRYASSGRMGIGGTNGQLFTTQTTDPTYLLELNPDTLATIKTVKWVGLRSVGGVSERLFVAEASSKISEVHPNTLARLNQISIGEMLNGIGGTSNRLFATKRLLSGAKLYEISLSSMVIIKTTEPPSTYPTDIGGTK